MSELAIAIPDIDDATLAFPASALDWMPKWDDIPGEYKSYYDNENRQIVSSWFFNGLPEQVEFYPRDGVDPERAVRAVQATLGSYAPSHQHKIAAASYMLDSWFEEIKNWKKTK